MFKIKYCLQHTGTNSNLRERQLSIEWLEICFLLTCVCRHCLVRESPVNVGTLFHWPMYEDLPAHLLCSNNDNSIILARTVIHWFTVTLFILGNPNLICNCLIIGVVIIYSRLQKWNEMQILIACYLDVDYY